MAKSSRITLLFSCLLLFSSLCFFPSSALSPPCTFYSFPSKKTFRSCTDLPSLKSHIHWNYQPSTRLLDIGFRVSPISDSRWIAWGINPNSKGMVGTQSLIAFRNTNGSISAYTSPITSYKTMLEPGELSFSVSAISASFGNNEMIIYATMKLPNNVSTTINHVWQEGPLSRNVPAIHAFSGPNMQSFGSLDLLSGEASGSKTKLVSTIRKVHAIVNAISWGLLAPIGVIVARYLKAWNPSNSAWFQIHIAIQTVAWIGGVLIGCVTGLVLGAQSSGVQYTFHRYVGIGLMVAATLQVLALKLKPGPQSQYRFYWNIYHHSVGYGTVVFGIVNVFKGFEVLKLDNSYWKTTYVVVLVVLGCVSIALEFFNWLVFKKQNAAGENDIC